MELLHVSGNTRPKKVVILSCFHGNTKTHKVRGQDNPPFIFCNRMADRDCAFCDDGERRLTRSLWPVFDLRRRECATLAVPVLLGSDECPHRQLQQVLEDNCRWLPVVEVSFHERLMFEPVEDDWIEERIDQHRDAIRDAVCEIRSGGLKPHNAITQWSCEDQRAYLKHEGQV